MSEELRNKLLDSYAKDIGLQGRDKMFVGKDRWGLGNLILGKRWPITGFTPLASRNIGTGVWNDHAFALWKRIPGNEDYDRKQWGEEFKQHFPEYSQAIHGHDAGIGGKIADWVGDSLRDIVEGTGAPKSFEDIGRGGADLFGASEQTKETVGGAFAMVPGMVADMAGPGKFMKIGMAGKGGKAFTGTKSWVPPVTGKRGLSPFTNLRATGARSTLGPGLTPLQARLGASAGTGTLMGLRHYSETHSPYQSIGMGTAGASIPGMMNIGGRVGLGIGRTLGGRAAVDLTQASTLGAVRRQVIAEQIGSNVMANSIRQKSF